MSGMSWIGSGVEGAHFRCETLVIETQLSSPQDGTIDSIEAGEILQVEIDSTAVHGATVVIKRHGHTVGGLASPLVGRLRECILGGTRYSAKVTHKSDALVRLRISPIAS